MGRAVIVDLGELDRIAKQLDEACAKMRGLVERAERGVPVRYQEENGVKPVPEIVEK